MRAADPAHHHAVTQSLHRLPHPLMLFVLLASASPSWAGTNVWTPVGPDRAAVAALAIDPSSPSTLYAGTFDGGVFKSTDGGSTWSTGSVGMGFTRATSLAIDPLTPTTLYTGTSGNGLFKSTDGAESWTAINAGLPGPLVSVVVDPLQPANLYAVTGTAYTPTGVYVSTNGGTSWTASNVGLTNLGVTGFAVVHLNTMTPATVYASTQGGGVFKSTDSGANWAASNTGLTDLSVGALAVDPTDSNTLYAGTPSSGIFKSTDAGASWITSSVGLDPRVRTVVIDPVTPSIVYAGINGGSLYKSIDGGATWASSRTGLSADDVTAIAVDPQHHDTVYAGANGVRGLFKSSDAGASWTLSDRGLRATAITAMVTDPEDPETLYAAAFNGGLFKSADGAGSWTAVNLPAPPYEDLFALAIDPQNHNTLHTSGFVENRGFRSTDGGATWITTNLSGRVTAMAVDPHTSSAVYAGLSNYFAPLVGGMFKSTDGGQTWADSGLTGLSVHAVAVDPFTSGTVYAATAEAGAQESTDGGTSWSATSLAGNVTALMADPSTSGTLYAGTNGAGFFTSTDGGSTWAAGNAGLTAPNSTVVVGLVLDRNRPNTIYAATGAGAYRSLDRGAHWAAINAGLNAAGEQLSAASVQAAAGSSTILYAGTPQFGVFKLDIVPCQTAATCDDANPCTIDTCDPGNSASEINGCVHTPVTCTPLDQCHDAGVCNPGTGVCSDPPKSDGTPCDDGSACTLTDTCQGGACSGGNPVACTPLDQCHDAGVCNPASGVCSDPPKADSSACNDGNACTRTDTCQAGACTGGNPVVCTPADQCHLAATCDPGTGLCSSPAKPDGTPCDDADPCTTSDVCTGGVCGGAAPVCGDGIIECGEVCDDGNTVDGDGCDSNCRPTGCGNGVVTTTPCAVTGKSRALWVFPSYPTPGDPSNELNDPGERATLVDRSAASGVDALFVSVYRPTENAAHRLMYEDADIADLIARAHAKGMEVWAAYGDSDWPGRCDLGDWPQQRMAEVIAYDIANPSATFDGVALDVEPPSSTEFSQLLQLYQCLQHTLAAAGLKVAVAIRYNWDDVVTFGGASKRVYEHVVDLDLDRVVVMGYRDRAGGACNDDGIVCLDQDEIAYADARGKQGLVLAGLETSRCAPACGPEKVTFYEEGQTALDGEMQAVATHFAASPGFGGFAIQYYAHSYLAGLPSWPSVDTGSCGEACDDGNVIDTDGCKNDCTFNVCGDGVVRTGSEQCDDGNIEAGDGCEPDCTLTPKTVSGTVSDPGGGTVTSDLEGDGATPTDPLEATVVTPGPGTVTISRTGSAATPPIGYLLLTGVVQITAPAGTPANPLQIVFRIDASLVPADQDETTILVARDGVPVPPCTGPAGSAAPDPCIIARGRLGDGDVQITVLTSAASQWILAASVCGKSPRTGCGTAAPGTAQVLLKQKSVDTQDSLLWQWRGAAEVVRSQLGDPLVTTDYTLCLYAAAGGAPRPKLAVTAPAGGVCGEKACWRATRTGYAYADSELTPHGLKSLQLKPGAAGQARMTVKGKGLNLGLPALPLGLPVTVQLRSGEGRCFGAAYSTAVKNQADRFKARSD